MIERLIFEEKTDGSYTIENQDDVMLGYLEKQRVGAWMTWCLFLHEDCYLSAGCLDEVREKIKELNAMKVKK